MCFNNVVDKRIDENVIPLSLLIDGISGAERAPSASSCNSETLLSPNLLLIPNLKPKDHKQRASKTNLKYYLVAPRVSRGRELNLVARSVVVSELFRASVGIVL